MIRSFRFRLAARFAGLMVLALTVLGGIAFLSLKRTTFAELDQALLRLAEIEASATSDAPASGGHFHDNVFQPARSEVSLEISRYAEIWTVGGQPVVRSANLRGRDLYLPGEALRAAVAGRQAWFTHRDRLGTLRSLVYPLSHGSVVRQRQILQVAAPLGAAQDSLATFLKTLLLLGFLGVAGSFGGAWYFAGQAIRPVRQIAVQADRLKPGRSAGDIRVRAESAEHQRLVEVLNDAFDRLLRAVQAQRQFTADASHEIRTPLAIIQGDIEVALRRERTRKEYEELLRSVLQEVRRLTRITDELLTLAKSDAGTLPLELAPVNLREMVSELVERYASVAFARQLTVDHDGGDDVPAVNGDEDLLRRAVGNVVQNAVHYASEGGRVHVSTQGVWREGELVVQVAVQDDGPGITPEDLPKLFDRFFRGSSARGRSIGTGLGLPIAKAIVEMHGGSVTVHSQPGAGTRIELLFPAAASPAD